MKMKLIGAALALLMSSGVAYPTCEEVWSPEAAAQAHVKMPPDFTCVRITDPLLVSLQGATKAQVVNAMKANGRSFSDKFDILHFVSTADDNQGGDVNFQFENDKVVHISGLLEAGLFIWSPETPDTRNPADTVNGLIPNICSDLPDSHYVRCNKPKK